MRRDRLRQEGRDAALRLLRRLRDTPGRCIEMKTEIHKKAKFITIERPLWPPPPIDSVPDWCYVNTLIFHDSKTFEVVWRQEIPEADLLWVPRRNYPWTDELDKYFSCSVFKDERFGWQLRAEISHERANLWLGKMLAYVKTHHDGHMKSFKLTGESESASIGHPAPLTPDQEAHPR